MLYCPSGGAQLTEFMAAQGMARLTYGAEFEGSKVIANTLASRSINYHSARSPVAAASGRPGGTFV